MNQRTPPLKGVTLLIVCSLFVLFAIALISRVTGCDLFKLILGFPVVVISLKLALKSEKLQSLIERKIEHILKEKTKVD